MPLTLINAPEDAEVLIVEMGARGIGHIAELCDIARPTIGVVTYVGAVHTSEFGTVERLHKQRASWCCPTQRRPCGVECRLPARARHEAEQPGPGDHVWCRRRYRCRRHRHRWRAQTVVQVVSYGRVYDVTLPVHGVHQVSNALAALAAAEAIGVSPSQAIAGLATAHLSPWRMQLGKSPEGATIINDAYNANAISTEAALRSLAALDVVQRFAVLGEMAELGDRHDQDHLAMAALCQQLGIRLIAYKETAMVSNRCTSSRTSWNSSAR